VHRAEQQAARGQMPVDRRHAERQRRDLRRRPAVPLGGCDPRAQRLDDRGVAAQNIHVQSLLTRNVT